jgi:hypothetical protein
MKTDNKNVYVVVDGIVSSPSDLLTLDERKN